MLINGDAGWSRRLICEWDTSGMKEDGCCYCCIDGEAGSHRKNTLLQFLQQKESRLQRMAQVLALALFLLISLVLAVLITVMNGGRGPQPPIIQPTMQPFISHSSGINIDQQQHKDLKNPSAMLTAARGENIENGYLKWESTIGHAFCHGGFNYSRGNLVVPRDGIYRVFLQITYESKECENQRLINSVVYFRDTYPDDVVLLSSIDTVSCSMVHWIKSLYAAGLFFLEANSRLRVSSSNHDLIVQKEHQVFFGAELLPQ